MAAAIASHSHHRLFYPCPSLVNPKPFLLQTITSKQRAPAFPSAASSPLLSSSSHSKEKDEGAKITSVSNALVKHCVKLRMSAAYRRETGSVLIVGLIPILEICKFVKEKNPSFSPINQLLLLEGSDASEELKNLSNSITEVSSNVMKKISGLQSVDSTQAIAIMKKPESFCDLENINNDGDDLLIKLLPSPNRILVLDGIQDPGNLGTLIRSARAFKWDGVFLLNGCCDPFNQKALRASRGASFQLPIICGNFSHLNSFVLKSNLKTFAGHPANNPNDKITSISTLSLTRQVVDRLGKDRFCLVLGSEGNGLSKEIKEVCELISIPMEGMFESLNVSVAGGIFLYMLQYDNCLRG